MPTLVKSNLLYFYSMDHNPGLCLSNSCKEVKEHKKVVIPLIASLSTLVIVIVLVSLVIWRFKKKAGIDFMCISISLDLLMYLCHVCYEWTYVTPLFYKECQDILFKVKTALSTESRKKTAAKQKNPAFSYSEVLHITNNFETTIGEGGFGKVYLGTLKDDTLVAVKLLSPSSRQGYKEFQSEVRNKN